MIPPRLLLLAALALLASPALPQVSRHLWVDAVQGKLDAAVRDNADSTLKRERQIESVEDNGFAFCASSISVFCFWVS